jgi:hypothetical protein
MDDELNRMRAVGEIACKEECLCRWLIVSGSARRSEAWACLTVENDVVVGLVRESQKGDGSSCCGRVGGQVAHGFEWDLPVKLKAMVAPSRFVMCVLVLFPRPGAPEKKRKLLSNWGCQPSSRLGGTPGMTFGPRVGGVYAMSGLVSSMVNW